MVELSAATLDDYAGFAACLHPLNREEIEACSGLDALTCLATLFHVTSESTVATVDNKIVCLFGVIKQDGYGEMWLVFSSEVDNLPLSFFKCSRRYVKEKLAQYGRLEGHIKGGNYFAMRWAEWMGFVVDDAAPYGINKELFHRFYLGR